MLIRISMLLAKGLFALLLPNNFKTWIILEDHNA
jgi:hypothetical protein